MGVTHSSKFCPPIFHIYVVSVPDPKPNPACMAFSIVRVILEVITCRMRSGDENITCLARLIVEPCYCMYRTYVTLSLVPRPRGNEPPGS